MELTSDSPQYLSISDLPGPSGIPFFGNLFQIDLKKFHLQLEKWCQQYGSNYKIKMANQTIPVISDPLLVHEVLRKRPKHYRQPKSFSSVLNEGGMSGLFSAEGKDWQRQRRLLNPAFSKKAIGNYLPQLQLITNQLIKTLNQMTHDNESINMVDVFKQFTTDITVNIVFGCEVSDLGYDTNEFNHSLDLIFEMITKRNLFPIPYWRWFLLPNDKRQEKGLKYIKRVTHKVIELARKQIDSDPDLIQAPKSILQAMIAAVDDNNTTLTNDELIGNVITLFLAGVETSANVLSWCCYYLAHNDTLQLKIYNEVLSFFSKKTQLNLVNLEGQLNLIESLILETLRLKSVVPLICSESINEVTLGHLCIPSNTKIILLTRLPGYDNQVFPEAKELKLERWLNKSKIDKCPHASKTHFPFGGGSRVCIGEALSMVEITMAIAWLCRNFKIIPLDKGQNIEEQFHFSMSPSHMNLKLIPRS